jgi:hypothetical protein
MSVAGDLLDRLAEIGARVEAAGNRLLLRAGPTPIPSELVQSLREAKAEVLAALGPPELKSDLIERPGEAAAWWRREFTVRTLDRLLVNRAGGDAQRLAFDHLVVEWYRLHGPRVPEGHCAGCGEAIGGVASMDLQDGNRVHLDKLDCLLRYGERWRGAATRALVAMGLKPPAGEDVDERFAG